MGLVGFAHIAAMSLTPRHFLTSWTIILILPPSPVSPESGTEMGGPGAPSSSWTESWVASDMVDDNNKDQVVPNWFLSFSRHVNCSAHLDFISYTHVQYVLLRDAISAATRHRMDTSTYLSRRPEFREGTVEGVVS